MYRLAVLADIHGNLPALEAVLDDIQRRGNPDAIWVLGDLVAFFPWLSETIDRLCALSNVSLLQGNTDRYLVTGQRHTIPIRSPEDWTQVSQALALRDESFRWMVEQLSYEDYIFLRDLPDRLEMDLPGYGRVMGVHAAPGDDEARILPETPDEDLRFYLNGRNLRLLLFGHTHVPMDRTIDGIQLVNPGSVGFSPGWLPRAAYGLLEFAGKECRICLHEVAYDVKRVIGKLEQSDYPGGKGLIHKLRQSHVS